MTNAVAGRWNHNIHYHQRILEVVPSGARTALDVGTGNGLLAADLHNLVENVTAIDVDAEVLRAARRGDEGVRWVQGDVMSHPFEPASFDVVATVATLHHMRHLDSALLRLAELTSPGGVLAIVGIAASSGPVDALYDAAGVIEHRVHVRRRGLWEHSAPSVWPPAHTYADVRRIAEGALPGARWTRLRLWRYMLVWRKPSG